MLRRLLSAPILGVLLGSTVACGSNGGEQETDVTLQILSWWTDDAEVDALNALLAVHAAKQPQVKFVHEAEPFSGAARETLQLRMAKGEPPHTFQANIGSDLLRWVVYDSEGDMMSIVQSLAELGQRERWASVIPAVLLDSVSFRGEPYGVPLNVHRQNNAYYNKRILDEEALEPPRTLAELRTFVSLVAERGYQALCVGNSLHWPMELFLFENLLPAIAGAKYHTRLWAGEASPRDPQISEALAFALELWPYFNADANELDWAEGIDRLFDPTQPCAMTVMGDWARAHFEWAGFVAGQDFLQLPFPGTDSVFVFSGDTFAVPRGVENGAAALQLLETFGSLEGQLSFNRLKGSIPARSDVNTHGFDDLTRQQINDFREKAPVRSFRSIVPAHLFPDLPEGIALMFAVGDPGVVVFELENDYERLIEHTLSFR